jgi:GrpB-like predicted nucleotidyltransferase (UPF0157 family)/GNAT superfamily N-acetyltransferase
LIEFERRAPEDPEVGAVYANFIREADGPLDPALIDIEAEIAAGPPADLAPPTGILLVAKRGGEIAAIGGVRHLDTDVAEVKSMYVLPTHRGAGLAGSLLAELERIAVAHGCLATRLDTSAYLTAAVALYRAAGYVEVPDYNGNQKADLWFERRLEPGPALDEPIRIVPYDPGWPAAFERERRALAEAIGPWAPGGIHHVGSTAVPGLAAKPVIDILVGVEALDTSRASFGALGEIGYLHAPYREHEMHWFCKPNPARRTHHLHLVPPGSRRFVDEIAFRDRLREDPGLAASYGRLKRELAARLGDDRDAYTEAKGEFIRTALGRSR